MQKDDVIKSSSFVPGDCNRICVPIQPTTFGNADLASNIAFVLVDVPEYTMSSSIASFAMKSSNKSRHL